MLQRRGQLYHTDVTASPDLFPPEEATAGPSTPHPSDEAREEGGGHGYSLLHDDTYSIEDEG